ncbi:major facilitator superfamily protein [mine drainage metagenome]|uniref:Major facilitator superfamily protein n=1 Tax=mine drainage metagenome TaxID=410659 RepID=A0A1J5S4U0_9ZZZZ
MVANRENIPDPTDPPHTMTANRPPDSALAPVLIYAALIVCVAMGIRHTFGLFLAPMSADHGWSRELFSFAIALQNLVWGAAQPFVGLFADRYGAKRVLWIGSLLYVVGLVGMAWSASGTGLAASAGLLIGLAQSGTTYSVVYSAMGQLIPQEKRSWAMGVVAAAGSFGQFLMVPVAAGLIGGLGWFATLLVFAAGAALIVPLGTVLTAGLVPAAAPGGGQNARQALAEASSDRGFVLLTLGYFVCGFQVVFIGVHLPTYLLDKGLSGNVGMTALALIGLFNVFGTYFAGFLGGRLPKRYLLAGIYLSRSVVISTFLLLPLSPQTVYVFAATMGFLWLATVPLTNAVIAQLFGVRFLGMLSGLVFFSHQIGSFLGVWLGGLLFDRNGNYNLVWGICIALGVVAALLNLAIDETALASRRAQPAVA